MDIKIAVAYHKESYIMDSPYLIPIHAGRTLSAKELNMQGDDQGDSISWKNPWYCEMTVLYWLWKNTTADYKGLMHYRRSFTVKKSFVLFRILMRLKFFIRRLTSIWKPYDSVGIKKQYGCKSAEQFSRDIRFFTDNLETLLKDGTNIIAPHPGRFYMSIRRTLCWEVGGICLDLMDDIVKEYYPDFFPYYDAAMNSLWFYNCNMSVMDNDTFNDYCSIVFSILKKHEEEMVDRGYLLDVSKEKAYSRYSGYLAEMLTNAYIQYSMKIGKKVKILPVSFLK